MVRVVAEGEIGPYTWDDFVKLPEDDRRELIDGHLVEVEVPNGAHEAIVAILIGSLVAWQRAQKRGRVMASGFKVRVSDRRGLMPDVQIQRVGGPPRPELGVEVISPSSRRYDRITKLEYYASIGMPEYWIIDPDLHTLERLVLKKDHYLIADSLAGDAMFRPATFEGLEIPLAELWEAATEGEAIEAEADRAFEARQRQAKKKRRGR